MPEKETIRLDKWLWRARFFRSRALASRVCFSGKIRIDGMSVKKAHFNLRIGSVLTFPQARQIRVVRIVALGTRRGPAQEAQSLYEDMSDGISIPKFNGSRPLPVVRWDRKDRKKEVW